MKKNKVARPYIHRWKINEVIEYFPETKGFGDTAITLWVFNKMIEEGKRERRIKNES